MLPYVGIPNIMAVDLGINGGICWNDKKGKAYAVGMLKNDKERAEVFTDQQINLIVAEDVRIFPGFSIVAGATFMIGKGFLIGAVATIGKTVEFIQPQTWIDCYTIKSKKHFKNVNHWKKHLLEIALKEAPAYLVNEINLKTCDAFLMWNYIARRESGNPMKKRSQLI